MGTGIMGKSRRFARALAALAALVAVAAACSDDATSPDSTKELSGDEAAFLSIEFDRTLDSALAETFAAQEAFLSGLAAREGAILSSGVPVTRTFTFERTRECPAGGQVTVAGSGQITIDREAGTAEMTVEGTKTIQGCAYAREDVTYTVNGTLNFDAHWEKVNRQLVEAEHNVSGSFTVVTSDGRTRECTVELHGVYDPATNTVHVTGEFCGRTVDRTRTRG